MKRASTPIRIFIGLFVIGSIFAYVETAYDKRFYSTSFLTDANRNISSEDSEINESGEAGAGYANMERAEEISEDEVADNLPKIQFISKKKAFLVDGNWEMLVHRTTEEIKAPCDVFYDKVNCQRDVNKEVILELKMVDNSLVMIDNLQENIFNISLLTEMGTIVLFRPMGDSYEIIEARKVKKAVVAAKKEESKEEVKEQDPGFHIEENTCFLKAHDIKRGNKILMGRSIEGSIEITNEEIRLDGIVLRHVDSNGKEVVTEPFTFNGMIQDNGTIFQDNVGGHVSIINRKEVRIMFAQGPLAQATLTFGIGDRCDAAASNLSPEKQEEFEEMMNERIGDGERLNPADELGTIEAPATEQEAVQQEEQANQDEQYEEAEDEYYEDEKPLENEDEFVEEKDVAASNNNQMVNEQQAFNF